MAVNIKYGLNSTLKNSAPSLNLQSSLNAATGLSSYRVKDIILDDKHPGFVSYGEWNSIGLIFIIPITDDFSPNPVVPNDLSIAYPLFPNIKHYPLLEEVVSVVQLVDANSNEQGGTSTVNYYLPPINIWNSQVHNALPSLSQLENETNKPPTSSDYVAAESGSLRRVTDSSTDIILGNTIVESNIINNQPLLPFEGDIIYEGRFGNSIRLGSTVGNSYLPNDWSDAGDNGSPIFILRNGQGTRSVTNTTESWVPTIEDINLDLSSIYLTSTQLIKLKPSTYFSNSYKKSNIPSPPNTFEGNQIILNSGRLFFNAKNDSIILTSANSIGAKANTSINLESLTEVEISSPKIYLGSANGVEGNGGDIQSVVLGENLMDNLKNLLITLRTLSISLENASIPIIDPVTKLTKYTPISSLNTVGPMLRATCDDIITNVNLGTTSGGMLSNIVKTK
jgi:hypothetical protein